LFDTKFDVLDSNKGRM
jgi:protein SEY1